MWYFYWQFTNFKGARAYCEIRSSVRRFLWFVCKKQRIIQIIAWQSNLKVKPMKICITAHPYLSFFPAIQKSDPFILMSYLLKYLCIYNHFHLNFYVVIQYFARTSIWWRPFTLKWILWYGNVWQLSPNSFPYQISSPKRIRWITMYLCFLLTTKDFLCWMVILMIEMVKGIWKIDHYLC